MPWIFSQQVSVQKQLEIQYGHRGATTYGNRYIYDQTKPQAPAKFKGDLISDSEYSNLLAAVNIPCDQSGNVVDLTVQGETWRGNIIGLEATRIMGTSYWECEVTLFEAVKV